MSVVTDSALSTVSDGHIRFETGGLLANPEEFEAGKIYTVFSRTKTVHWVLTVDNGGGLESIRALPKSWVAV